MPMFSSRQTPVILHEAYVNATTSGTGAETLYTYTLPAGTLSSVGDTVEIFALYTNAANGNSKAVTSAFGGQAIGSNSTTANGGKCEILSTVMRTGASTQVTTGDTFVNGSVANSRWPTATAVTDTAAIAITWGATTSAQAGDITLTRVKVVLIKAVA